MKLQESRSSSFEKEPLTFKNT